jgi:selenocysteine lyase/cysteine desulfurase
VHGDRLLHWQYVSQLLNDLFGIQCRGGCLCAGPYAMNLLGITEDQALALESQLLEKDEMVSDVEFPGVVFVRSTTWLCER